MKNLSGKELMRNDMVIAPVGNGVVIGYIQQFYDRPNCIRISGYPIMIPAADTVLAEDAWKTFGQPLLDKRKADEAAAASAKVATQKAKDEADAKARDALHALQAAQNALKPTEPLKTPPEGQSAS